MKKSNFSSKAGSISRQQLIKRSGSISISAKEDLSLLQKYGITPEILASLDEKIVNLKNANYLEDVMLKRTTLTNLRDLKAMELSESIGLVRSQLSFLDLSEEHAKSSVLNSKLSGLGVEDLLTLGQKTRNLLRDEQADLAIYGVTPERVTAFETLVNEFETLHHAQSHTNVTLNNYTSERLKTKSELFQLVWFVAKVGKSYWLRKDKSRYGDYVLHKHKAPPAINTAETEVVEMNATNF